MSISHYSYKYGHGSKEFSLESDTCGQQFCLYAHSGQRNE